LGAGAAQRLALKTHNQHQRRGRAGGRTSRPPLHKTKSKRNSPEPPRLSAPPHPPLWFPLRRAHSLRRKRFWRVVSGWVS